MADSELSASRITFNGGTLDLDRAVQRLETLGRRRLFFVDESGPGNILYDWYDGHYGLIIAE